MASDVDPDILTDAILLHVEDLGEVAGKAWLRTEFDRVFDLVMAGDEFVTATSFKGQSGSAERKVSGAQLLAVLTQARKMLNAEENGSPAAGAMLVPRLADFPLS